jgi:hypothetical protein
VAPRAGGRSRGWGARLRSRGSPGLGVVLVVADIDALDESIADGGLDDREIAVDAGGLGDDVGPLGAGDDDVAFAPILERVNPQFGRLHLVEGEALRGAPDDGVGERADVGEDDVFGDECEVALTVARVEALAQPGDDVFGIGGSSRLRGR